MELIPTFFLLGVESHFMAEKNSNTPTEPTPKQKLWGGILFSGAGVLIILLGLGIIPSDESDMNAHPAIVQLCGVMFLWTGIMIFTGGKSKYNDFLGGMLVLMMGIVAGYVAFFGTDDGMSGGLGFLSRSLNLILARGVFGFGSLICIGVAMYAFVLQIRKLR